MPASPAETRASLILRLRDAEDVSAWDEFAELYGPVVYRIARARGLQPADAENLVQEVLFAVAQSVEKWLEREDKGSFRRWLLALARNHAVKLLTKRATRALGRNDSEAQRQISELQAADEISLQVDLEYERAVFQWAAERVQQAVADHTWQAFWLTQVEGLSASEVVGRLP